MNINKDLILDKLTEILDPELNISIVDLGLLYDVILSKDKQKVKLIMTLTTIGCPLSSVLEQEIKDKIESVGIQRDNIELEITFDPPWSLEKMTERGKAMLGI